MPDDPIQILEVRADDAQRPVTVTAAVRADAGQAIYIALSEQLDRRRRDLVASPEDVLALRRQTDLVERFAPVASARAHAILQLTEEELRACLVDLNDYRERVDGEHFQPIELRQRLHMIAQITGVLWEANAAAVAASDHRLRQPML
jgi:uncharacterized protein YhaN